MRKLGIALVLVVLSVAAWVVTASAISGPQVFTLLSVDSGTAQPINGFTFDRAPRAGDQFGFRDNLYRWAGTKRGAKVGSDQGIGTFLTVTKSGGTQMYNAQVNLGGGTILVGGITTYTEVATSTFKLAVTGGTGRYDNVRGYVVVKQLPGSPNRQFLTFHLLP